ncbi:MAG: glycosyltransferase family 2 protein [Erysipelotrichaceae bacterium]|nr:glycosyltransferase family 2 protein [Erysipelotrichaceae bacterium]
MINITVVTPTYNRAHTLNRVFDSLMQQTYRDFKWLVVDDGSTDDTAELVKEYKEKAWFPVDYVLKEHAGKYEAVNLSYKLVDTKYIINCDSDDAMLPNGLETIMKLWSKVPEDRLNQVWCVTGRCLDSVTGKIVGDLFPENINGLRGKDKLKVIFQTKGEKHSCRLTNIVSQFPYPSFPDTGKLVPNHTWIQINAIYEQYCSNDPISIYYQDSLDSLAKSPSKERKLGYYYYALLCINDYFDQFFINPDIRYSLINISRCGWRGGKTTKEILDAVIKPSKKILVAFCMPISAIYNVFFDKHKKGSIH